MRNKKTIYMISGHYAPDICGIADYTRSLTAWLTTSGYDVTITASHGYSSDPWTVKGVGTDWSLSTIRKIIRDIRQSRPHIVHLQFQMGMYHHFAAICFLHMLLRLCTRCRLVTTFHDFDGPPKWGKLHRMGPLMLVLFGHASVVCSKRQYAKIHKIPILGKKVVQIAVGPTIIPPDNYNRKTFGDSSSLNVLCFGFIWKNRGLESVITACAKAYCKGYPIRLIMAGKIIDRHHVEELRHLGQSQGLDADRVVFTDALTSEEVAELMEGADFCILPFPTGVSTGRSTFSSCVAFSLPIITTFDKLNCPAELQHGENVLLYNPGDDERLAEYVECLCKDPELRRRLGNRIRQDMSCLDWNSISKAHSKLYLA